MADAQDMEHGGDIHGRSLTAGLTALREVRDFVGKRSVEQGVDLESVAAGHRTPVLKHVSFDGLTAVAAQQRDLTFAQDQLAIAAGGQPAASSSLYSLGRASALIAGQSSANTPLDTGTTMVYYQAALVADANNFRAANELGVLLAENGRYEMARQVFNHALRVSPQPATWRNIARVYERLGRSDLAAKAMAKAKNGSQGSDVNVKWVDPGTFAQIRSGADGLNEAQTNNPVAQAPSTGPPGGQPAAVGPSAQAPSNSTRR